MHIYATKLISMSKDIPPLTVDTSKLDTSSFGRAITSARKQLGWSQKELARKIHKEDGESITPQYLNDIEHDRRSPSSDHMVRQFATVFGINPDILYGLAGRVPDPVAGKSAGQIEKAFVAFRKELKSK
jgi:transcriptional regulator with XRE-family HTH domain